MVSFNDRPTIHVIPFYRASLYQKLFWQPEDLAEFRRDSYTEKDEQEEQFSTERDDIPTEPPKSIAALVQVQVPVLPIVERDLMLTSTVGPQRNTSTQRVSVRPEDWLPLQPRRGKIGYAKTIKAIWEVDPS